jgi:hypothetical protein
MFEKIIQGFLMSLIVAVIAMPVALWGGFVFMIGVGALHGWIPAVPTIGYWTAVLVAYAVSVLSPLGSSASK